ncbi:chromate transporter [Paenibacillus sp. CC-CFT747]|nr:chromate transporter [Paenibacillus sp. CC-CFT747]
MIPVIEREVVQNRKWITSKEMADVLSVSGSTPGGIGVNAAVFVGYRLGGIPGPLPR